MVDPKAFEAISEVRKRREQEIMTKKNVVGLGIGFKERRGVSNEELSLVVLVSQKLPEEDIAPEDRIPLFLDGFPVDVQEVGKLKAF